MLSSLQQSPGSSEPVWADCSAFFTRNSEKIVSLLLSFAGGAMLCIVCLDLLTDALGQVSDSVGHVFFVVAMTAVGFGLIYLLNAIIDKKTNPQVSHIGKDHPKQGE